MLEQAIQGDQDAFAALIEANYAMIFRLALAQLGNQENAEDVAQEVCIKVGKAIGSFRQESQLSTWLYRITLNTIHDFRRRQRDHQPLDSVPEPGFLPPQMEADRLSTDQLWTLVRQLPDKLREAVLLVYGEEMSHKQAAEVMDCAEGTLSWYISEAKKKLKLMVQEDG